MPTLNQYKQAKALVETFRAGISSWSTNERDTAWQKLTADVQDLGFASANDVFDFESQNKYAVIPFTDEAKQFSSANLRVISTNEWIPSTLREDDSIPDTAYIFVPDVPTILISSEKDIKEFDLDYCKKNNIIIQRRSYPSPIDVVLGVGTVHLRIFTKNITIPSHYIQHLFYDMMANLGITGISKDNNDILINGKKIAGCNTNAPVNGVVGIAGYFNFNFKDKELLRPVWKDSIAAGKALDQIGSLHEWYTFTKSQVVTALLNSFNGLFGKSITISTALTKVETDAIGGRRIV
jgi:lipoate-protein ligase A